MDDGQRDDVARAYARARARVHARVLVPVKAVRAPAVEPVLAVAVTVDLRLRAPRALLLVRQDRRPFARGW